MSLPATSFTALTASLARTTLRSPAVTLLVLAAPPALLLATALATGGGKEAGGPLAAEVVSASSLGLGTAFASMLAGATSLARWREKGVMRLLWYAPVSAAVVLGAALAVSLGLALAQALLVITTAVTPVVGLTLSPWAPLCVVAVLLGASVFYGLGVLVGLAVRTVRAALLVVMVVVASMGLSSGVVLPLDSVPGWAQALSRLLPLTYLLDGIRWPLTGAGDPAAAAAGCGILAVTGAVLLAGCTRLVPWR